MVFDRAGTQIPARISKWETHVILEVEGTHPLSTEKVEVSTMGYCPYFEEVPPIYEEFSHFDWVPDTYQVFGCQHFGLINFRKSNMYFMVHSYLVLH